MNLTACIEYIMFAISVGAVSAKKAYPSVKSFDSFHAKKPRQRIAIFYLGQTTLESVVVLS